MCDPILELKQVKKYFPIRMGMWKNDIRYVHAVDNVSIQLKKGEVLGLVGETGCGKSTLASLIMGIYSPTSGDILLNGRNISEMKDTLRLKRSIQMVFQDPFWSLNPRKTIRNILAEPLKVHHVTTSRSELNEKIESLFKLIGMDPARLDTFPHEFAGGERQLIGIARSISLQPEIILLDEPTSAIDTFSQARILNLLIDLKNRLGLSYIVISHDLSVIHYLADTIAVMYLGKIVESGSITEVFTAPYHPYTQALLKAIPTIDVNGQIKPIEAIKGDIPSAINPPAGCRFAGRCPYAMDICFSDSPRETTVEGSHIVACHKIER